MDGSKMRKVLIIAAAALALVAVSCDDDDDVTGSDGVFLEVTHTEPVKASTVAPPPADGKVFAVFDYFALGESATDPSPQVLLSSQTDVEVTQSPAEVLGPFDVEPGTYAYLEQAIQDVYVVDGENDELRCDRTNLEGEGVIPLEEALEIKDGILEVSEDGTKTLLLTLPVLDAYCE